MNAFIIYRKEFNNIITNYNLELKDISKYSSISWKQEPQYVKKYYKQLAKKVKELFKERTHSLCFVNSNLVSSTNDNNVSLDSFESPFLNTNRNFLSPLDDQKSPSPYSTYSNYPFLDMNLFVSDNFENSLHAYITMDDNELMNYISEDLALTYRAIVQSLSSDLH
ncbi:7032_t:CDS:1 [Diversispora eburnea]|uniref:7032_t:CDS:1 n=1 Tax=Diversispora eburnea TaxID=1213867 RepID=A0A9N9AXQ9_9GLOM|nr:7032_t:CDS:1 [Diversispora eburnea]